MEEMAKHGKEEVTTIENPVEEVAKGEPVVTSEVQSAEQEGEDR